MYRLLRWGLFALGAPQHKPLRQAAIAGLSAIRSEEVTNHAGRIAAELVADLRTRGTADLVGDYCKPLASRMFCLLVGLDEAEADGISDAVDAIADQLNGVPGRATAADAAAGHLRSSMERLAAEHRSALISAMEAKLGPDSPATTADLAASFIFDAVEMVATGLFGVIDLLVRCPEFPGEVLQGRYLLKDGVQEAFRLVTPATLTSRMALETVEWRGHTIAAGTPLIMWWGLRQPRSRGVRGADAVQPQSAGPPPPGVWHR
jgi:cytochrome P450